MEQANNSGPVIGPEEIERITAWIVQRDMEDRLNAMSVSEKAMRYGQIEPVLLQFPDAALDELIYYPDSNIAPACVEALRRWRGETMKVISKWK